MKPVAFSGSLDVFEFCTPDVQAMLKKARDAAQKAEEDRITAKLKGQLSTEADDGKSGTETIADRAPMDEDDVASSDPDLAAALAMSLEEVLDLPPVGPGLPKNFQGHYELFGVVTHKGRDADGGHYMAWVKADQLDAASGATPAAPTTATEKIADSTEENEDWFVFDDDEVSPCKTEDILKLKGGGDWHMSYLNFYRAKK
jgi:ubiquitin carboxyl-terminal hydrolase 14